jgi:hypothetical protein
MLLGEEIQMPDGFGRSGVEEGFFGPANKENAGGQPKPSYLRNNPVPHPQFTAKARKGRPSPSDANADTSSATATTRQGSVYSAVESIQRYFYDIADDPGSEEYFKHNPAQRISKKRMESGYFNARFSGQFHPHVPVPGHNGFCQSCKYFASVETRKRIERCVICICQVNLCWKCRLTWHGVGMEEVNRMLSE